MKDLPPSFNTLLLHYEGTNSSFLRYCMSDKVSLRLDSVLEGSHNPLQYASHLVKYHYRDIYASLFEHALLHNKPSALMTKALVFDRALVSALLMRASVLRPHGLHSAKELLGTAYLGLLFLEDPLVEETALSGLSDFSAIVENLTYYHQNKFLSNDTTLLSLLGKSVSSIASANWLFYRPVWKETFGYKLGYYKTLRGFFHIALTSYMMSDENLPIVFDLERYEIIDLMVEFIEMVESEDITQDHIERFLYHLNPYTFEIPRPQFLNALLEEEFETVEAYHQRTHGDTYTVPDIPRLDGHQLGLTFLRSLGPDYAPELVIETNLTPSRYVNTVIASHRETLYRGASHGLIPTKDMIFQSPSQDLLIYTDAILKNTLIPQIVFRRYLHFFNEDINLALQRINQTKHFLLILSTTDPALSDPVGLAYTSQILTYHLSNQSHLSLDDLEIFLELAAVLKSLCLDKPSRMTKHWKDCLAQPDVCRILRMILFTVAESVYLSQEDLFLQYTGMTKNSFFLYMVTLTDSLRSYPSLEELRAVLALGPMITTTVYVTYWDQLIWSEGFSGIPSQDAGNIPCIYRSSI